jgi:aldose 1-epimerase
VEKKEFGKLKDGRSVRLFILKNAHGATAEIIEFGATIISIKMPDRDGKYEDVILGYDSLPGYIHDNSYFGAIVGRYGNRIRKGKFSLAGKEYQLPLNNGENHLHGGPAGFHKLLWQGEIVHYAQGSAVKLRLVSPDGDQGYPGKVTLDVTYVLTDKNELRIDYTGETDKETILNPTNHTYFNLSGSPENDILDHELMIRAKYITPMDEGLIPTGDLDQVENTPFDFREPSAIGGCIDADDTQLKYGTGYDHNWVLDDYNKQVRLIASLSDSESGRYMEVYTDQPGIQFYSGNFLDGSITGKNGMKYKFRTGLCLETQHFPDSPNRPEFPSVTLKPGEQYKQTTIYSFSMK